MRVPTRTFVVAAAVAATVVTNGVSFAAVADDTPPPLEEDYSYPNAQQILAERGILLISGDGHLQLVTCGQPGLIEVRASATADHSPDPGHYCFKASAPSAYLKLKLDNAFQVKGDEHAVQATVKVNNQTSTVNVDRNGWTGIGFGAGGDDPATLLELKVSP